MRQACDEHVGGDKDGCSLPLSSYWSSSPLSCIALIVILVGIILIVDGVSVAVGIVVSSSLLLAALCGPLVLSLRQLVVVCHLCRPIIVRRLLVLCPLVVPAGRCVPCCICCPILLLSPLVHLPIALPLSSYHVAPPSSPLVPSAKGWLLRITLLCHAGWFLLVVSPLLPFHLALPSRPLIVLLHAYPVHGLLGRGGCGWLTVSCLSPFARVWMLTAAAQMLLSATGQLLIASRNSIAQGSLACARTPTAKAQTVAPRRCPSPPAGTTIRSTL